MKKIRIPLVLSLFLFWAAAQAATDVSSAPDYGLERNWLCKPGRVDACATDINATEISRKGEQTVEPFVHTPDDEKKIDCFYVYPTVSTQDADVSNLEQESAQFDRIRTQFARFSNVCRLFAPMYRQVTLKLMAEYATDLKKFDPNAVMAAAPQYKTAYDDVVAAWKHYLAHDNHGRGVILIGHSQGSFILRDLIKNEIDGKADQKKLVSAYLAGVVIATSKTNVDKNEFKTVPVCTKASQTGCFISFSSFEADAPPPSWSKAFGMSTAAGTTNNCSNPAELSSDNGRLIPYIDASRTTDDGKAPIEWTRRALAVGTPLVKLPDFLKAKCVTRDDGAGYLSIDFITPDASGDLRKRHIPGHVIVGPVLLSNWGVHDADMELVMGNLVKLAGRQAASWSQK
ncbi:hypothetical protein BAR24066_05714 [Burkholderia arboris]|uniref:DUF3089 domain-containing protein n=1 Tax=Burkholderia arboris TaxID=488730 RepID=A0A9Q9SNJ9_9BURK|nr:DUF3089 domain-containing protein [Burkholderia arboris]VWC19241.1 hypothetical protein BAR24066_05714 [Burkholderia arboris]